MAVGYDNSHYFSRLFKKYTGMTPLEYRNRNKEQDEAK
ncbi:MAG: AraC family transcriptional regulator [Clostridia bacterium]|nr:AraC family transcriptional regulator [Clostridia bacterium]